MSNPNVGPDPGLNATYGTIPDPVNQEPRRNRRGIAVAGGAVAALIAAGAIYAGSNGDNDGGAGNGTVPAESSVPFGTSDEACEDFSDVDAASDPSYNEDAFLPGYDVIDDKSELARNYVAGLFDENGPLGHDGDLMSLAAFMAAVGSPANDAEAVDPEYNYAMEFIAKTDRYRNGGIEVAREDCKTARDTAIQTAGYETDWARAGEQVSILRALREEVTRDINGFVAEQYVTQENMSGIVFRLRSTSDNLDGFADVLVASDGTMYVKGLTVGNGVKVLLESPITVSIESTSTSTTIDGGVTPNTQENGGVTPTTQENGGTGTTTATTTGPRPTTGTTTAPTTGTTRPTTPPSTSPPTTRPTTPPTTPPTTTPPTTQPPVDKCDNLAGIQTEVPAGWTVTIVNGKKICKEPQPETQPTDAP